MALAKVVRNFVYKCPECGATVNCFADIFSLSEGYTNHCECGGSSLRAEKRSGKYRVNSPCGFCGETHSREFSMMELVRGNPLFIFCPLTDRYCACIGSEDKIRREVSELEKSFETGEKVKQSPDEYWNAPAAKHGILQKMISMAKAGLMGCVCGANDMRIELIEGETYLRCTSCGNRVAIPTLDGITPEEYPEINELIYTETVHEPNNITPINGYNNEKK